MGGADADGAVGLDAGVAVDVRGDGLAEGRAVRGLGGGPAGDFAEVRDGEGGDGLTAEGDIAWVDESGFAEGVGVETGADEGFCEEETSGGLWAFGGGEEFGETGGGDVRELVAKRLSVSPRVHGSGRRGLWLRGC